MKKRTDFVANFGALGHRSCVAGLMAVALCLQQAVEASAADPLATWHVRQPPTFPTEEQFEGVAFGNGRWVIVGAEGTILSSPDGVEWMAETNPTATPLNDVAFGAGRFVAIGSGFKALLSSPDGRQWTKHEPSMSGAIEIIHDGSRFVVVTAGGGLYTSTNGADWDQEVSVPVNYDIGGIAYGNATYVEVGYKRTGQPPDCFSSFSFSDWSPRDSKLTENLMNAGFGLGLFYAMGQKGAFATSPDGMEWTVRTLPHTGFIWDLAAGGNYVAAAAQWGRILTSENGIDWAVRETELSWHFTDIAFGNGTFIAVGWDGQIAQSDPTEAAPPGQYVQITDARRSGDQFSFKFSGEVGRSYEVQISADLNQWQPLTSVNCTEPLSSFSEPASPGPRFYRVKAQ